MDSLRIEELVKILSSERNTAKYLFEKKNSSDTVHCPFCNYTKFYLMGRKRTRCRKCRKDYDFLKPTWFGRLRISYAKWLLLIKIFEVGISPHKFLLYIKEIECRYNNRKNNLFDLLIDYMLGAVRLQSPKIKNRFQHFSH